MYALQLFGRINESSTAYRLDLTLHALDWRRTSRALGGFWNGDFTITTETMGLEQMTHLFQTGIGCRIVEMTAGIVTWEGEIVELTLTRNGIEYTITLDNSQWANRIMVKYGSSTDDQTAWSEQTGSSDIYGESCLVDIVSSQYTATSAAARRDRLLTEMAYPKSRTSGGLSYDSEQTNTDNLRVMCTGYVFSMNRRYQLTDIAAAAVSTQIGTIISNSEFVTAGRITANSLSVPVSAVGIHMRLWDTIVDLIEMGDATGNRWVGGCWAHREFHYYPAQTTVTHYWRNGRLVNLSGQPLDAEFVKPDILVQVAEAPSGSIVRNGASLDDPKNVYIEEVEFIAPDRFRLIPHTGGAL